MDKQDLIKKTEIHASNAIGILVDISFQLEALSDLARFYYNESNQNEEFYKLKIMAEFAMGEIAKECTRNRNFINELKK